MEIPFKRVVWNEHEAALLVDTFEKVRNGVASRDKAIIYLSKRLRNRMVLDGIAINEKYRNVAGMDLQLLTLERSVDSNGDLVEDNKLSQTFRIIYLLSKNSRDVYNAILSEANLLYPNVCSESESTNAEHPYEWLAAELTGSFVSEAKDAKYKAHSSFDWNKCEAALLVDGYYQISKRIIVREDVVSMFIERCSNCSPVANRCVLPSIEDVTNAYCDIELLTERKRSVINDELQKAFNVYHNDNARFNEVLNKAKQLYPLERSSCFRTSAVSATSSEQTNFVPKRYDEQTIKEIEKGFVGKSAIAETVTENSLSKFTPDTLSKNSSNYVLVQQPTIEKEPLIPTTAVCKTTCKNIDEELLEILAKNFSKGYRLNSSIARKRFAKDYAKEYGKDIEISDEQMDLKISGFGIVYNGMVYVPSSMIDEATKQSLFNYIENQFANGIACIYYNVLFEHFRQQFLEQTMIDGEMLRYYLEYYNVENTYHFNEPYFSKETSANIDINEEVVDFVKEQGGCVTEEEIAVAFAHLPREKVIEAFSGNYKTLVRSSLRTRFHIDNFQLEDIDKIAIVDFLSKEIASMQYVAFSELFDKMRIVAPRIIENNIQFTQTGIRTALSSLLADKFHFIGGFISNHDNPVSAQDVFISMGRGRESFNIEDVEVMANDFNVPINFEALAENNVRISETIFVSKDHIAFDTELVDTAIATFCIDEFVGITEVNTFAAFPECGYRWTPYLLESYIYSYSRMFTLKHKAFNKTSVTGAIVRNTSHFKDYLDIMAAALANAGITLNKQSSLEFLAQNGYIERRRLNTIDDVIRRAETLKNN
ncbi:hypothetical protein M2480_002563 [Parabacteroides sp. PFB2-12]|uniref:hypothetical protein n=1 Tax=unclassified Parabacteroides TaxID=2649774 RepID=UPI0024748C18|nr:MULTISPECIES: hypothetical protein [unclassified Parabacteroides]MDH6344121.1 hypothetical protein [Parabacteroides sp. PM6-13]MDH6391568.1 hypothetical protein [Parabacteroides sp. PFB2-12]